MCSGFSLVVLSYIFPVCLLEFGRVFFFDISVDACCGMN